MKNHVLKLGTGDFLKESIEKFSAANNIKAGVVVACVGNLSKAFLRMADGKTIKEFNDSGSYEIVSLSGTLENDYCHLHMSISDNDGG